jgi:tetratricopeptide (TPR) repeat protein
MKTSINRFTAFILLLTFISCIIAQEGLDFKQQFVEAESYFLFEEYKDALPIYQRLLREDPDNLNLKYKIGICYLNNPYQKEKSINYLQDASEGVNNKSYKPNNHRERLAPPEVYFYLAQAYRVNNDLEKALKYFTVFKNNLDPEVFDIGIVHDEIEACNYALKQKSSPVYFKTRNAENLLNSRFAEECPVISGDGNTIIFNRKLQFYDAVFISTKNSQDKWSEPVNLTPDFGLDGNSYCTGISFAGDEIYVYRSDNFDGNIYLSVNADDKWQKLEKLNESINTKYWESHASPGPEGKYLYFTSNRRGGYGGLDIYKAIRIDGGTWGNPVNLGPVVNSRFNEETPFISPNNQKLYFSSLGHNGMGGYDIYISELIAPNSWSTPINIGYPLNSTDDDLFFCPSPDKSYTAVYSMYDTESSFGLKDIYFVTVFNSILPRDFLIEGSVNVPTPDFLENEGIRVSIIDNATGRLVNQVNLEPTGEFSIGARQGDYQLLVDGEGIKPVSIPVTLNLTQENNRIEIPVITAQLSAIGEDKLLATPSDLPEIKVVGPGYFTVDTVPVIINLEVEKGNDLFVELFFNNKQIKREEYRVSKDVFAYKFTPDEGLTKLIFTLRNENGNIKQEEVNVFYQPDIIEESPLEDLELKEIPLVLGELATISSGGLQDYFSSHDELDFTSYSKLYSILLEKSSENDYSANDIHDLFSVLLTQRDKKDFVNELSSVLELDKLSEGRNIVQQNDLPIVLIKKLKEINPDKHKSIELKQIGLIPVVFSDDELLKYILSFSGSDSSFQFANNLDEKELILKELVLLIGEDNSSEVLDLSVSTRELNQYFNNLLVSAGPELKPILSEIEFSNQKINNSIDLIDYLFKQANAGRIAHITLINELEKALKEEDRNIILFKEILADFATGELKMDIQDLQLLGESKNSKLIAIVENLLNDAHRKEYSKGEVYDLLLRMIGIEDVDDFVNEMLNYTSGELDSLLINTETRMFSSPLEIIQYLLSESSYFNYTVTDINNLLMRMLLERGIDGKGISSNTGYSKKLIQKKRLTSTLVLVGILIIILLLLFVRRRRKSTKSKITDE